MENCDDVKNNDKNNDFKIIRLMDEIELNGNIYYIPNKYLEHNFLPVEHIKLYKFIIVLFLDNHITNKPGIMITKPIINNFVTAADKLFSYIITGKLYINIMTLTNIEKQIIEKIPGYISNQLNTTIIEKLE
jgi:hypothetical protein